MSSVREPWDERGQVDHAPSRGRYQQLRRVAVGDYECLDCGCLVIDREAHDRWHLMVEPIDQPRVRVIRGR